MPGGIQFIDYSGIFYRDVNIKMAVSIPFSPGLCSCLNLSFELSTNTGVVYISERYSQKCLLGLYKIAA